MCERFVFCFFLFIQIPHNIHITNHTRLKSFKHKKINIINRQTKNGSPTNTRGCIKNTAYVWPRPNRRLFSGYNKHQVESNQKITALDENTAEAHKSSIFWKLVCSSVSLPFTLKPTNQPTIQPTYA